MRLLSEVFETSASASSANPPTSLLDHTKADPMTLPALSIAVPESAHLQTFRRQENAQEHSGEVQVHADDSIEIFQHDKGRYHFR